MAENIAYLKSCTINEQVYLACLLNNPDLLNSEDTCYCLNPLSIDIFNVAKTMYDNGHCFTTQTLTSEVLKKNEKASLEIINALKNSIEYNVNDFTSLYKKNLIEAYVKNEVQSKILKRVSGNLLSKGELDVVAIQDSIDDLSDALNMLSGKNKKLKDFPTIIKNYEDGFINNTESNPIMSTGNVYLDKKLAGGGIAKGQFITIFGSPGMGKSSYARKLVCGNIAKRTPLLYLPLEMGETLAFAGIAAHNTGIPLENFLVKDADTNTVPEYIIEAFNEEKEKLLRNRMFRMVESSSSLADVQTYIREMKKELKVKSVQVVIDLFTMLSDGKGDNKASVYQDLCDGFMELLKEENSTGIAVVQSRRKNDINVATYDDCRKYMPKIEEIKNAAAFEERSRAIIAIFRQKHIGIRAFGQEDPVVMISDDILEAHILKQNLGSLSELKYLYEGETGRMWKYEENTNE